MLVFCSLYLPDYFVLSVLIATSGAFLSAHIILYVRVKKLTITSWKQISPFSNFTLALVFITYIWKISVSNTCLCKDACPLGCCVLSTDKEIWMFRTIFKSSFYGFGNQKSR